MPAKMQSASMAESQDGVSGSLVNVAGRSKSQGDKAHTSERDGESDRLPGRCPQSRYNIVITGFICQLDDGKADDDED